MTDSAAIPKTYPYSVVLRMDEAFVSARQAACWIHDSAYGIPGSGFTWSVTGPAGCGTATHSGGKPSESDKTLETLKKTGGIKIVSDYDD